MNHDELKQVLEDATLGVMKHACKDLKGDVYTWQARKPNPKCCPRCARRLWRN